VESAEISGRPKGKTAGGRKGKATEGPLKTSTKMVTRNRKSPTKNGTQKPG